MAGADSNSSVHQFDSAQRRVAALYCLSPSLHPKPEEAVCRKFTKASPETRDRLALLARKTISQL